MPFKMSNRLSAINQMITQQYDAIWDCCCDHGYLGRTLLTDNKAQIIHFVDNNQHLINHLESQLENQLRFSPSNPSTKQVWKTHCIDAAQLPLNTNSTSSPPNKQLIILAGVGGDLVVEIIQTLLSNHSNVEMEFIVCPVHHHFKVRTTLIAAGLKLINEKLIEENKRYYEIIHVGNSSRLEIPVSNVGSTMWDLSRSIDQHYLKLKLAHYQRRLKNGDIEASQIIAAYSALS